MSEVEMITALKKVEIKFQELVEKRKVFNFFDEGSLKSHEARIKSERDELKIKNQIDKMKRLQERNQEKLQSRIDAKQKLVVTKNIRDTIRSRKPDLNIKKNETIKVPPEVEEMRRYLGIVPDDWNISATQHQPKAAAPEKKDPEASTAN
mmetsp:Transcript_10831/g.13631  ORF Transcript_10831/g.13631 Transcript_10831/m.13631 type:complete len:150 (+) Transcript_10831:2274-2723(+)